MGCHSGISMSSDFFRFLGLWELVNFEKWYGVELTE